MRGNSRESQRHRSLTLEALSLLALAPQEGEGEVESFDLTLPSLGGRPLTSGEEILLQFIEPRDHLRVDRKHRAADAGVFVLAGSPVGASAGAEFENQRR
ncbi:hypothetical protein GCM10010340_11290 [Streptomyces griseoloalbus]|nr:hypothetical protein GCM10010340_11290 [Streptomyces albaduncus]